MVALKITRAGVFFIALFSAVLSYALETKEAKGVIYQNRRYHSGSENQEAPEEEDAAGKGQQEAVVERSNIVAEAKKAKTERDKTLRPFVQPLTPSAPMAEIPASTVALPAFESTMPVPRFTADRDKSNLLYHSLFFSVIVILALGLFYYYLARKNPPK